MRRKIEQHVGIAFDQQLVDLTIDPPIRIGFARKPADVVELVGRGKRLDRDAAHFAERSRDRDVDEYVPFQERGPRSL